MSDTAAETSLAREPRLPRFASEDVRARVERGFNDVLGDERQFVEDVVETMCTEVPFFATLPRDQLHAIVDADFRRGIGAMLDRRGPTQEELQQAALQAELQARLGMPVETMLQGWRVAIRRVWELCREYASSAGLDAELQLDYMHVLWTWADAVMVNAAATHRRVELEIARTDQEQRNGFLRALLFGSLPAAELRTRGAAYRLAPGSQYLSVRARPADRAAESDLIRAIEVSTANSERPSLLAMLEGDVVGVVASRPRVELDAIVAIGPPAPLDSIAASFALASRALETASAFGMTGVTTIDELSLRPAILSEGQLGDRLVRRYVEPLGELGDFGATLERTLRAYLELGLRVDETARALFVHPNTLRHRLERFEQITGVDLRSVQTLLELWWALERRQVRAGAGDGDGDGDAAEDAASATG